MGPTIQQGVIQCPVQQRTQFTTIGARPKEAVQSTKVQQTSSTLPGQNHSRGNLTSDPRDNGRDRLPEREENSNYSDYVMNSIDGSRPFPLSEVARPVFVNHYYGGKPLILVTSKRLIRLDESDITTENSVRNPQPQAINCEFLERLRDSLKMQQPRDGRPTPPENSQRQDHNRGIHREFVEPSWNLLRILTTMRKGAELMESIQGHKGGFHSEFVEPSQHLPGTVNMGRSWVQVADCVDPPEIPLAGYQHFPQEMQTYPVSREPMTVQTTVPDNNSALLDLPNVQMNLPPPLIPQQSSQVSTDAVDTMAQPTRGQDETPIVTNAVSNSEILESIQNITKVMQQQLMFNSKTVEQGIIQTASLFQEMIKSQEKRDLDPALLAIPTFSGEAADRPKCLDWVSRVMNVCDQSGHSFRQELINKSGILVQNFIRSLGTQITNKDLTEKVLQFFSDVPMI